MMCVSIQKTQMAASISKTEHMCQFKLFLYRLCKDEREKLGEKKQKARHWVTLRYNDLLKSSLTQSWEEAGEWVLILALLSHWQLAPTAGAHSPAPKVPAAQPCPFLP